MSATSLTAFVGRLVDVRLADRDLLDRFVRTRDEAAFAGLVRRHGKLVWGVCRNLLSCSHDAEDAFQSAFVALARKAVSLPANVAVAAWLHGAATCAALEIRRKAARRRAHESRVLPPTASPLDDTAWRELQTILLEELRHLPETFRAPFVLCCLEGQSKSEAARLLGWPEGSVSGRLAEARRRLRRRLARRGISLGAVLCGVAVAPAAVPPAADLVSAATRAAVGAVRSSLGAMRAVCLGVTLVVGTAALALMPSSAAPPAAAQFVPPATPSRPDRHGDPLPDGALARLGSVRFRHGFITYTVAYSPDGKTLASGGGGRGLVLWDADTGREKVALAGTGHIYNLAFSPDGSLIAAAYEIKKIRLWETATGREVGAFEGGGGGVPQGIAFSGDGKTLACGGYDGMVHTFDVATGKPLLAFKGHDMGVKTVALSPDGSLLVSGGLDKLVRFWDTKTGQALGTLEGHTQIVLTLALTADGKTLLSGGEGEGVRFWDIAARKQVRFLEAKDCCGKIFALAPGERTLAMAHRNGVASLWDIAAGKETKRWAAHAATTQCLAFRSDGTTLATGALFDSTVRFWDAATGRALRPVDGPKSYLTSLSFSEKGQVIHVAGRDRVAWRWNWAAGTATATPTWPPVGEWLGEYSPDCRHFASTKYQNSEVRLWQQGVAEPVVLAGHEGGVAGLRFSPDGATLATGDAAGTVRFWDVATAKETRRLATGKAAGVLTFSADGTLLATGYVGRFGQRGGGAGAVRVWEVSSGKERSAFDLGDGAQEFGLAFAPDGRWLAAPVDDSEGGIYVWDLTTGRRLALPETKRCVSVAFSPDSRFVAWGNDERINALHVAELATGKIVVSRKGHHTGVVRLAFAPDGRLLASGGGDSTVLVWDLSGAYRDGRLEPVTRSAKELEGLWTDLADADAARAYRAMHALAATAPDVAIPFLKERLRPEPAPEPRQVAAWLRDLDGDEFAAREKAAQELRRRGAAVAGDVRRALEAKPSAEARKRLTDLLEGLEPGRSPALRRVLRGLSVVEMVGTPAGRAVAERAARDYEGLEWLGREARQTAQRLKEADRSP